MHIEQEEKKSYEVTQMEALIESTWWKLILEKADSELDYNRKELEKTPPSNETITEREDRYRYHDNLRFAIKFLNMLKQRPDEIIDNYSNENFTGRVNR